MTYHTNLYVFAIKILNHMVYMTDKYLKIYYDHVRITVECQLTLYHDEGLRRNIMYHRQNIIALRLKKHCQQHNHSKALPLQPLHLHHNPNPPNDEKSMSSPITGMKKLSLHKKINTT